MVHTSNINAVLVATIALRAVAPSFAAPINARVGGASESTLPFSSGQKGNSTINRSESPYEIQYTYEHGSLAEAWGDAISGDDNSINQTVSRRSNPSASQIQDQLNGGGSVGSLSGGVSNGGSSPNSFSSYLHSIGFRELEMRNGGALIATGAGAAGSAELGIIGSPINHTIDNNIEARSSISSDIAGLGGAIQGPIPREFETRNSGGALMSSGAGAAGPSFNRNAEGSANPIPTFTFNGTNFSPKVGPDPGEIPGAHPNIVISRDVAKADLAQAIQNLGLHALKRELELELELQARAGSSEALTGSSSGMSSGGKGLVNHLDGSADVREPAPSTAQLGSLDVDGHSSVITPLRRDIEELFTRVFEGSELD